MNRISTQIIAEIGTSHQGDLSKAIELIHAAKESGADTAKFQWVYADEIIHPNTGIVKLPGGNIPLYDRFKQLEQGKDFFASLKAACDTVGIGFLCTPFGLRSAKELLEIGADSFKIASPELNHGPLLEFLGATGLPLIVSSGVSKLADIEEALEVLRAARKGEVPLLDAFAPEYAAYARELFSARKSNNGLLRRTEAHRAAGSDEGGISLLHCMTAYPAPEAEYNLLLVDTLASVFVVPVGVSDHSMDPVLVPVVTTILGGRMIEKHFTMSNETNGLDDPIALAPSAFKKMSDSVRAVERVLESGNVVTEGFGPSNPSTVADYITYVMKKADIAADTALIRTIIGNGRKFLAATESANYGRTNRSIHATRELAAGEAIQSSDLCIVRTEKVLRPGLHPRYLREVIGKRLSNNIPAGEGIRWEDLLTR